MAGGAVARGRCGKHMRRGKSARKQSIFGQKAEEYPWGKQRRQRAEQERKRWCRGGRTEFFLEGIWIVEGRVPSAPNRFLRSPAPLLHLLTLLPLKIWLFLLPPETQ